MRFPHPPVGGRPPADYRVDRPEVEAPRGAREPTGTNGPTLNTHQPQPVDRHPRMLVATMRITTNTNPQPPNPAGNSGGIQENIWLNHLVVVIAAGKRPASIPNLEAKPASADGTAPGRVWESRTPPQHTFAVGSWNNTFQDPTALSYPQHDTGPTQARLALSAAFLLQR